MITESGKGNFCSRPTQRYGGGVNATSQPATPTSDRPARSWLFTTAMTLFVVGLLGIAATFAYAAISSSEPPFAFYAASMACPLGFILAITYALRSGRRSR